VNILQPPASAGVEAIAAGIFMFDNLDGTFDDELEGRLVFRAWQLGGMENTPA
jgi:hypothetical protein